MTVYTVEVDRRTVVQIDYILEQIKGMKIIEIHEKKYHCYKYSYAIDEKTGRSFYSFELELMK